MIFLCVEELQEVTAVTFLRKVRRWALNSRRNPSPSHRSLEPAVGLARNICNGEVTEPSIKLWFLRLLQCSKLQKMGCPLADKNAEKKTVSSFM